MLVTSRRTPLSPVPAAISERLNGMNGNARVEQRVARCDGDGHQNWAPSRVLSMSCVTHWPHWKDQSVRWRPLRMSPVWAWTTLLMVRGLAPRW